MQQPGVWTFTPRPVLLRKHESELRTATAGSDIYTIFHSPKDYLCFVGTLINGNGRAEVLGIEQDKRDKTFRHVSQFCFYSSSVGSRDVLFVLQSDNLSCRCVPELKTWRIIIMTSAGRFSFHPCLFGGWFLGCVVGCLVGFLVSQSAS